MSLEASYRPSTVRTKIFTGDKITNVSLREDLQLQQGKSSDKTYAAFNLAAYVLISE